MRVLLPPDGKIATAVPAHTKRGYASDAGGKPCFGYGTADLGEWMLAL
jgi:hypothetical protein